MFESTGILAVLNKLYVEKRLWPSQIAAFFFRYHIILFLSPHRVVFFDLSFPGGVEGLSPSH